MFIDTDPRGDEVLNWDHYCTIDRRNYRYFFLSLIPIERCSIEIVYYEREDSLTRVDLSQEMDVCAYFMM